MFVYIAVILVLVFIFEWVVKLVTKWATKGDPEKKIDAGRASYIFDLAGLGLIALVAMGINFVYGISTYFGFISP